MADISLRGSEEGPVAEVLTQLTLRVIRQVRNALPDELAREKYGTNVAITILS
jgi:hypothetical protein